MGIAIQYVNRFLNSNVSQEVAGSFTNLMLVCPFNNDPNCIKSKLDFYSFDEFPSIFYDLETRDVFVSEIYYQGHIFKFVEEVLYT